MNSSSFILPQPFAWMPISAGDVILNPFRPKPKNKADNAPIITIIDTLENVDAFDIAKYPLTNGQYSRFVESGGYQKRQWWTDVGWEVREREGWTEPKYWQFRKWNRWYYPVVGVSWYEALAYCRWLSDVLEENISLPTEAQWQRAAQGDTRRFFAWGDEWDSKRCNHGYPLTERGRTSPVTQYEGLGDSFFGVVDMTGNVWEYTLTKSRTEKAELKIAHGGSWELFKDFVDYQWWIRTDERMPFETNQREKYLGFRIVSLLD